MKLKIVEKIEKEHPFNSRNWNYQKIIRYLLSDENNRIIEAMVIWHIKDGKVVEFLLELSNMYNCPVGCQFWIYVNFWIYVKFLDTFFGKMRFDRI